MTDVARVRKVELPLDKQLWTPSPLPGQVVLVTTLDDEHVPNVAPKSWVSMVAFGPPPVLMFGCTFNHATASNAVRCGAFVVNIPGRAILRTAWRCGDDTSIRAADRWDTCGLTPIPSLRVDPPRIAECHAHLECETDGTREYAHEVAIFGRVVSASVDESMIVGDEPTRYRALAPFFFLENGWAAELGTAQRVDQGVLANHSLTILAVSELGCSLAFYRSAFGWPLRVDTPVFAEFGLPDGRGLGLYQRESFGSNTGQIPERLKHGALAGTELYFHVDNLDAAVTRLESAGARLLSRRATRTWGDDAAYYADPDGNVLVVAQRSAN